MMHAKFVRSSVLALIAFVALSCSESPTDPLSRPAAPAIANDGLLSGLTGTIGDILSSVVKIIPFASDPNGINVRAVQWGQNHVNQVRTVSAVIGPEGGLLVIPGSDFSIFFPVGALSAPTPIAIVSDASGYVSYDMQPHGLNFAKPVIVKQRLRNTAVYGTPQAWNVFGAYFPNDLLDLTGILKALEIERTTIFSGPTGRAEAETWQLNHFSRYMLTSG